MKYELDTIYQAFVESDGVFARLYFVVDYNGNRFTVKDAYDTDWHIFPVNHLCPTLLYRCSSGEWHLHDDGVWTLQREEFMYRAVVSKADDEDPVVKDDLHKSAPGKHYDAIVMDDMPGCRTSPEDTKKAVDWYKRMFDLPLVGAKRRRTGIITSITEGGNEMGKSLFHVILFNRKTEKIDFKEYIPALEATDACMVAAQRLGKYDPKIHITIVKQIDNSEYREYISLPE